MCVKKWGCGTVGQNKPCIVRIVSESRGQANSSHASYSKSPTSKPEKAVIMTDNFLCIFPSFPLDFGTVRHMTRPPLWSSGQGFWLQIQRSRVRFPALPDFLSSSGSGTGSTQPREVN